MLPNYEFRNARYNGPVESEKYNQDFNNCGYNIITVNEKLADQSERLLEGLEDVVQKNAELRREINFLEDSVQFFLERMEVR